MSLSDVQYNFISKELGISKDDIDSMNPKKLRDLREKCFDIEVEEAVKADNDNIDISERGETAADIVDILLSILKAQKVVIA